MYETQYLHHYVNYLISKPILNEFQNESENFALKRPDEKSHWQKIVNFPDDINYLDSKGD